MVKRIHIIPFYALLTLVYTVFFSVQCFFNFDLPGSSNVQNFVTHSHSQDQPGKTASLVKEGHSHSYFHSIRLNKRFHQENIPTCDILTTDTPESYVIRRTLGEFRDSLPPAVLPAYLFLRGPPAVA